MNPVSTAASQAQSRSERLDAYLAQDPSNERLLADAFEAAIDAQRLEAAGRHLQAGLAASGQAAAWRFRQATWAIATGELVQARQLLADLRSREPHPVVDFNLGYVLFRQAQYADCAQALEPLLGAPGMARAQAMWLRSLHQLGEVDRAWAWVQEVLRSGQALEPDVGGAASLVAFDAEHFVHAAQLGQLALRHQPGHPEALVAMGSVALARQDAGAAARMAQAVLAQRDDGRARSLLGFAQLLLQQLDSALASFERAVALMPAHIGTWHGLGWTRLLLKDLEGAAAAFEQALALDRNFGESHGSLAVVLAMQGRADEASAHAQRARRLDPEGMAAQYAQLLLAGGGDDPAAVERLARALLTALGRGRRAQPPGGDSST